MLTRVADYAASRLLCRGAATNPPAVRCGRLRRGGHRGPAELFGRYLAEQAAGDRVVVVAEAQGRPVGYLGVLWRSDYQPFRAGGIPEIVDLNVQPRHRRQGLGTALLDAAEATVASRMP